MNIAFWSPMHGTGTTSALLAVAAAYGEMEGKKLLLSQTHYNLNNLEYPLLGDVREDDFFRDTGIDAALRHFKSGNVTDTQLSDCTIKIGKNLYLLAGTHSSNREGFENDMVESMIIHILLLYGQYYDIVFTDTNSGFGVYSMKMLEECDAVVVSLNQNLFMLDSFLDNERFKDKKMFYLFTDYDSRRKYNIKNISAKYKQIGKNNSGIIPHSARFADSICDKKAYRYITDNLDCDSDHADYEFFTGLKSTIDKLKIFLESIKSGSAGKTEDAQWYGS